MSAIRVVRARLKPLAEIPEAFLCCDEMRKRFAEDVGMVLESLPDKRFEAEVECRWCHKILTDAPYVRLKYRGGRFRANCIAVPLYEFDEGLTQ